MKVFFLRFGFFEHGVSMGVYRLTKIDLIVDQPTGCRFAYNSYLSFEKDEFEILFCDVASHF